MSKPVTTAQLIARANEIDERLGPIGGRAADTLAVLLRETAKRLDALLAERAQLLADVRAAASTLMRHAHAIARNGAIDIAPPLPTIFAPYGVNSADEPLALEDLTDGMGPG